MSNTTTPAALTLSADDKTVSAAVTAVRSAVRNQGTWLTYVTTHNVTADDVKVHAAALASLAFPNAEPVQKRDGKRTAYGNAVQAAGNGMRYALKSLTGDDEDDETEVRAVNLITREGAKATLAEVTAAWHAAQK